MEYEQNQSIPDTLKPYIEHSLSELQGKLSNSVIGSLRFYTEYHQTDFGSFIENIATQHHLEGKSLSEIYESLRIGVSYPSFSKMLRSLGVPTLTPAERSRIKSLNQQNQEVQLVDRELFGLTGVIGKDGLLTREQEALLNGLQEQAADHVVDHLNKLQSGDKFPLVAMATGIGKGNIIHRVISKTIDVKPDAKILVIAGTKLMLVAQTQEALQGYQDTYVESEDADISIEEGADDEESELDSESNHAYTVGKYGADTNVQVATIQTLQAVQRKEHIDPKDFDLVIVDEVHNIGTSKRLEALKGFIKAVGFTATPYRYSGRLKSPDQYGFDIIESLTLPEIQELRLLPPLCGIQIDTKDLVDDIPMTATGKIDFKGLEKILKNSPELRPYIADRVAGMITGEGKGYKTVIAVNFVWEAQELAQLLHDKGIKVGIAINQADSEVIHTNEIPALDSIDRYKLPMNNPKAVQVLISPYVASEGFDAPFMEVLVWASPTDSSLRYTQYTGRLARRFPGKAFGVVVDCLYQTNQYNWSYNFGMWMKDDVKQLENGMLWLGPGQDIEIVKELPVVRNFIESSSRASIEDLQKLGLIQLQDSDFPISIKRFLPMFIGEYKTLGPIYNRAKARMIEEFPEVVTYRLRGGQKILCADEDVFIRLMIEEGAVIRASDALQEEDFVISWVAFQRNFIGEYYLLKPIIKSLLENLKLGYPKSFKFRRDGDITISVFEDRSILINEMLKLGAKLRNPDIVDLKYEDFPFTVNGLSIFIGGRTDVKKRANQAMDIIRQSHPDVITRRTVRGHVITVVTNKDLFVSTMISLGAKLK